MYIYIYNVYVHCAYSYFSYYHIKKFIFITFSQSSGIGLSVDSAFFCIKSKSISVTISAHLSLSFFIAINDIYTTSENLYICAMNLSFLTIYATILLV